MKSGQSLSEYSLCLAVILLAIIAMNAYVKRGLQGRYADITDTARNAVQYQVVSSAAPSLTNTTVYNQYEPYYTQSTNRVSVPSTVNQVIAQGQIRKDFSMNTTEIGASELEDTNVEE